MAKHNPRKIKVQVRNDVESISNLTTSDMDLVPESFDKIYFLSKESTTADPSSEEASGQKGKAIDKGRTWPDTFTEMLSGTLKINTIRMFFYLFLAWILLVVWIYIQDNGANKLDDWLGIRWLGIKSSISLLFFCIVALILKVMISIETKYNKRKKISD